MLFRSETRPLSPCSLRTSTTPPEGRLTSGSWESTGRTSGPPRTRWRSSRTGGAGSRARSGRRCCGPPSGSFSPLAAAAGAPLRPAAALGRRRSLPSCGRRSRPGPPTGTPGSGTRRCSTPEPSEAAGPPRRRRWPRPPRALRPRLLTEGAGPRTRPRTSPTSCSPSSTRWRCFTGPRWRPSRRRVEGEGTTSLRELLLRPQRRRRRCRRCSATTKMRAPLLRRRRQAQHQQQ